MHVHVVPLVAADPQALLASEPEVEPLGDRHPGVECLPGRQAPPGLVVVRQRLLVLRPSHPATDTRGGPGIHGSAGSRGVRGRSGIQAGAVLCTLCRPGLDQVVSAALPLRPAARRRPRRRQHAHRARPRVHRHLKNAVARANPSAPVADRQSGRTDTPQTTTPYPHHLGGGGPRARPTASDSRATSPGQGRRRGRLPGRPRRRSSAPRPRGCRATRRRRRTERGNNRSAPGQKVTPVCPPAPPPCGAGRGRPERPPRSRRAPRRYPWPPRASPTGSRWTSTPRAGPARSTCPAG